MFRHTGKWSKVTTSSVNSRITCFAGHAVGRKDDGSEDCWATEKFMVDSAAHVPIDSTVLIAPHHGANNASSDCFIDAVDSEWVIFPAGSNHRHPRAAVAQRYLDHGVPLENMFRTDLGDDDIEIIIQPTGGVTVR